MRPRWWLIPLAVVLAGSVATALETRADNARERRVRRAALHEASERTELAVHDRIQLPAESLHTVGAFLAHAPDLERATFEAVAADVFDRTPRLYALEYAPMTPAAGRDALEADARRDVRPDWTIREAGPDGLIPATVRPRYLPILFSYPTNEAWGFDALSRPEAAAVAMASCDRGEAIMSPRYRLVEDIEDVASVIIYEPIWRAGRIPPTPADRCASVTGFGILIFRVGDVLADAIATGGADPLDVVLDDITDPTPALLFENRPGAAARAARALHTDAALPLYGRTWRLRLAFATPAPFATVTLVIGLALTVIASGLTALAVWYLTHRRHLTAMTRLGQYQVEREIGRGAMGVVYRAHHTLLGRPAALKLLAPDLVDAASRARFEREVKLAAQLHHPGIVTVYDFGVTAEGLFFYAMELLDGVTLRDLIHDTVELPLARTVHLVRQIAEALREAHRQHIVHRDLAPANLMVTVQGDTRDVVKVLDFGLVKRLRRLDGERDPGSSIDTEAGIVIGSPGFIAPEVLRNQDADERVDVYALGAVWYALLTGRTAFTGSTPAAIMKAQLRGAPVPLRKLRPDVPAAVEELIAECMQPDPRLRVRSMAELLLRIDALDIPPWTQAQAQQWWSGRVTEQPAVT